MSLFRHTGSFLVSRPAPIERNKLTTGSFLLRHFNAPTLTIAYVTIALAEFLSVAIAALAAIGYHAMAVAPGAHLTELSIAAAIFVGAGEVAVSAASGQFRLIQQRTPHRYLGTGLLSVICAFVLLAALLFVGQVTATYSPLILLLQMLLCCTAVLVFRSVAYTRFKSAAAGGLIHGRRVVLIGRQKHFEDYARQLRFSGAGVQIICRQIPPRDADGQICTTVDAIASTLVEECRALQADDVVLLADEARQHELSHITASFMEIPAAVYAIPRRSLGWWAQAHLAEVAGVVAVGLSRPPMSPLGLVVKRGFDIVAATLGLIILSPLMVLISIAIKLDSRGPVLFMQTRHGYNNRPIRVFKFRSMRTSPDAAFLQATKKDPRITRLGRLLRITSVDELPQLMNVLRGDMSIVGPRPHAISHNAMFVPHIKLFSRRHNVKPGLTGWAQVNGFRGETDTIDKMIRRIECDLYYVDNWSLWFDLQIIALTLFSKKTYTNAG